MSDSNPQRLDLSTQAGYDLWSAVYDSDGNPLIDIEEPHVDRLLGPIEGLAVIDIGCGTGRHAIRLAQRGARVTAVDFSAGMLAKARAKPGADAIAFVEHDLTTRLPLPDGAFDRVLCCLVLDHIHDLAGFFAELRRLCKPGGHIVATVMHPAMMLRGVQARFHDPETGQEIRPASAPNRVSDYVMAALGAGLEIRHLSEHEVDETLATKLPRAQKYLGWPILLLLQAAPPSQLSM